jgi:hypothetical protein
MGSPQRFAGYEALECFVTEAELAKGEIAFAAETAFAKPDKISRCLVFRAIDDEPLPNVSSIWCNRSGCLCSRNPKSVAGWCEVAMDKNMLSDGRWRDFHSACCH